MAQTKKKRRRKHRGTQGGRVDANRSRPVPAAAPRRKPAPAPAPNAPRAATSRRPGAARSSAASVAAVIFTVLLLLIFKRPLGAALGLGAFMLVFYIPAGYYIDLMMWRRRERARMRARTAVTGVVSLEVRQLTVGADRRELLRRPHARAPDKALIVDPGEEPERILAEVEQTGAEVEAILITHCHFDHVGAVAPVARETGAPVYCPEIEVPVLADIMSFVPCAGFGPYESYEADEVVKGGEALELAGLTLDVLFTPGHSPGHVTYAVRDEEAIFSGDVLFQGSVGRVDLPGGDGPTLIQSIQRPARLPLGGDDGLSRATWA